MKQKLFRTTVIVLGVALSGFSIWWGGQEIWRLASLSARSESLENLDLLEKELKEARDSVYSKYNLASIYYRQERYEEAKELLVSLLNDQQTDAALTHRVLFNLGNSLYRMAEREDDTTKAIKLLEQSLISFRTLIDAEKQTASVSVGDGEKDEDAAFNYILVRTKLKLLNDQLAKREREQEKTRSLYQLLKELRQKEAMIAEALSVIKRDPSASEAIAKREELLNLRNQQMKQLQIVKEKMLQTLSQPQS